VNHDHVYPLLLERDQVPQAGVAAPQGAATYLDYHRWAGHGSLKSEKIDSKANIFRIDRIGLRTGMKAKQETP
jgi:hypothetical protein